MPGCAIGASGVCSAPSEGRTEMSVRLDSLKTRLIAGGFSVTELARRSNTSDLLITGSEAVGTNGKGGTCTEMDAQRLLDALAPPVTITTNTQANPTVVTTAANHNLVSGDTVTIAGNTG